MTDGTTTRKQSHHHRAYRVVDTRVMDHIGVCKGRRYHQCISRGYHLVDTRADD